jgi:hypothetical protein
MTTKLRSLRDALRETWEEIHAEKCTNTNDCRSFGGSAVCYCQPPPELSAEPSAERKAVCKHGNGPTRVECSAENRRDA